jgi:hypothetical protein
MYNKVMLRIPVTQARAGLREVLARVKAGEAAGHLLHLLSEAKQHKAPASLPVGQAEVLVEELRKKDDWNQ